MATLTSKEQEVATALEFACRANAGRWISLRDCFPRTAQGNGLYRIARRMALRGQLPEGIEFAANCVFSRLVISKEQAEELRNDFRRWNALGN